MSGDHAGASQVLSLALAVVHTNQVDLFTVGETASAAVGDIDAAKHGWQAAPAATRTVVERVR